MRVLHCFTDIGGNASGLAAAQRSLGIDATMVSFGASPIGFSGDRILVQEGASGFQREVARFSFLLHALKHYDVFHFYFGDTFLTPRRFPHATDQNRGSIFGIFRSIYCRSIWMKDLPLLRAAGKTIAMTFLGDDIRTVSYAERHNPLSHLLELDNRAMQQAWDEDKTHIVAAADRYADIIYATNPDLLGLLPERARFLPYTNLNPADITPAPIRQNGPLRVMHAPTHRVTKGTSDILSTIGSLKRRSISVEFQLIENQPYQKAREMMAQADIFIDQLKVGWYGGACVEAMATGAIGMAYLLPADIELSPFDTGDIPITSVCAETLEETLELLLHQPREQLQIQADACRGFVQQTHDPISIARQVLDGYVAKKAYGVDCQ